MRFYSKKSRHRSGKGGTVREQGFTLIETTIAMVVMMVAGLGAVSLFFFSVNNNAGASERAMAVAIAQQRIERLRSVTFTDASLNATAQRIELVTVGSREFTVRTVITGTDLRTITVQVAPQGRGPLWARGAVTFTTQRAAR